MSSNSAANLDHILTNNLKNKLTLVFCKGITDHFPIVCSVKKYKSFSTKIYQPRFFGDKPKLNSEEFSNDLHLNLYMYNFYQKLPALYIVKFSNLFNNFAKFVLEMINRRAPLKQAYRCQKRLTRNQFFEGNSNLYT